MLSFFTYSFRSIYYINKTPQLLTTGFYSFRIYEPLSTLVRDRPFAVDGILTVISNSFIVLFGVLDFLLREVVISIWIVIPAISVIVLRRVAWTLIVNPEITGGISVGIGVSRSRRPYTTFGKPGD